MGASTIIDKDCEEIQAAMGVALLKLKNAHGLTYQQIGKVMEREKQSVAQYINNGTDMPAACWLKAVAEWPDLANRLEYELDDAEKDFQAHQRKLPLTQPEPETRAA